MKILECSKPNDNIYFLHDIMDGLDINQSNYKWVISDLNLVPAFHGDYSGIGGEENESISYKFLQRMEQEQVVILDGDELYCILEDTQTIRNGVFICLEKQYVIDTQTYRPKVESSNPDQLYDKRAICELRILDGGLFFVL